MPTVSLLTLNYYSVDSTVKFLNSLGLSGNVKIFVGDNGSKPKDREILRKRCADLGADLVEYATNRGFASGMNDLAKRAIHAGCDLLIIVNNDVLLPRGFVDTFVQLHTESGADISVPRISSKGRGVDFVGQSPRRFWPGVSSDWRSHGPPSLTGACMGIDASAWTLLEGFDSRFFFGVEDLEMTLRARQHGLRVAYHPSVVVVHEGWASLGIGVRRIRIAHKANVVLLKKHRAWMVFPYVVGATVLALARSVTRRDPGLLAHTIRGLVGGLLSNRTSQSDLV